MLLSIVIPCHDRPTQLRCLLRKLETEIKINALSDIVEIIIVDDASLPALPKPESLKPYINWIRNSQQFGAPRSRQIGFMLSRGRYVHFHDSDDSIPDEWLRKVISYLATNDCADITVTARERITHPGRIEVPEFAYKYQNNLGKIRRRLYFENCLGPIGGVIFARNILESANFSNLASCQDWQLYVDAIRSTSTLIVLPNVYFVYDTTRDDRISASARRKILGHLGIYRFIWAGSAFRWLVVYHFLAKCETYVGPREAHKIERLLAAKRRRIGLARKAYGLAKRRKIL